MIEGELKREGVGLFDRMNGVGAHEVVIETPRTRRAWATSRPGDGGHALGLSRPDPRPPAGHPVPLDLVFKNHGEAAGASLEHSHSQIIALPVVPSV